MRSSLDFLEAKDVAKAVGVSLTALYNYERGEREPMASTLTAYADRFGVSPRWLLTGEGQMYADPSKAPGITELRTIDQSVFRQVGRLVAQVHTEEGVRLPPDALLDEQSSAYNTLIERAEDPSDTDELLSLLPWLEARIRKSLKTAAAEPGTGKHQV